MEIYIAGVIDPLVQFVDVDNVLVYSFYDVLLGFVGY